MISQKTIYALIAGAVMTLSACDTDVVPEGQTILNKTSDLELLLNEKEVNNIPYESLGIIVNESYGSSFTPVSDQIKNKGTMDAAMVSYDETADRAKLASKDSRYNNLYKYIQYMNVLLEKLDGASGDEADKPAIAAEAHINRAWFHFLALGCYAKQYDEKTKDNLGIAYVTEADVNQKHQETIEENYKHILDDCSDELIALLPEKQTNVVRLSRAAGYAIRARVLFQMKNYKDALTYAEKALALNSTIEDRSVITTSFRWSLPATSPNNFFYISPLSDRDNTPSYEQLSVETAELFEDGDYVKDYAYSGGKESEGEEFWNADYGYMDSGIEGCLESNGSDAYVNAWGLTVERVMYLAAECYIREGQISKGLELVNKVREKRIDADHYKPFTATTEAEAMEELQQAKFIECIATFENFFDRKRWNTEEKYKKNITRHVPDSGDYTITPESPLWVFPFPVQVMNNNPTFKQNY